MKVLQSIFLLFCVIPFGLFGFPFGDEKNPADRKPTVADSPVSIIVATDLHFIDTSLTDNGAMFQRVVERADGKVMYYVDEITDAFVDEVIYVRPDAVLLLGDLSYNGEYESLSTLSQKLKRISETGIAVLVLPGNHDIESDTAAKFFGDSYEFVTGCSAEEFKKFYEEFGYAQAINRDNNSFSYIYELRNNLRILMLDTNSVAENKISRKTFNWVKKQLRDAQKNNVHVLAASHQNVLPHNKEFIRSFVIDNANWLAKLYKKYGVIGNVSGHMHVQHISHDDNFFDIASSSLAIFPHEYGVVSCDGENFSYRKEHLDVSSWAKKKNISDENLLSFDTYSKNFFLKLAERKTFDRLLKISTDSQNARTMARCFAEINCDYFCGKVNLKKYNTVAIELWNSPDMAFDSRYMRSIQAEDGIDHTSYSCSF